MWLINRTDISERFGVYLKKGAYSSLLSYPTAKPYLTEETRDEDGERVLIQNQRRQARIVSLPCVLVADDQNDFWRKYDEFVQFLLGEGVFDFTMEEHNRTYRFYYVECSDFTNLKPIKGSGKKYSDFTLTLREPNPKNVRRTDVLNAETGEYITTEDGETIKIDVSIYH